MKKLFLSALASIVVFVPGRSNALPVCRTTVPGGSLILWHYQTSEGPNPSVDRVRRFIQQQSSGRGITLTQCQPTQGMLETDGGEVKAYYQSQPLPQNRLGQYRNIYWSLVRQFGEDLFALEGDKQGS